MSSPSTPRPRTPERIRFNDTEIESVRYYLRSNEFFIKDGLLAPGRGSIKISNCPNCPFNVQICTNNTETSNICGVCNYFKLITK